jgi:pyruvate dehydrogenase E1 component alpha subunit
VFVVSNNQWAISVPRARQTAAQTLAQKAIAAGIPGEQADGNDVLAVHGAVARALERARSGGGASVIEALTYRLCDHTTADDASRYRDDAEVTRYWAEEPLVRLRRYLAHAERWGRDDEEHLLHEISTEIDAAATTYLATTPQDPGSLFDYTFARLPSDLAAQRQRAFGDPALKHGA